MSSAGFAVTVNSYTWTPAPGSSTSVATVALPSPSQAGVARVTPAGAAVTPEAKTAVPVGNSSMSTSEYGTAMSAFGLVTVTR